MTQGDLVRRVGLPQQIAAHLVRRIVAGGISSGSAMPTEQELMQEFHVGKSAVREAIQIVATKGLIETQQGSGTRVTAQRRWNLIDSELVAALNAGVLTMDHVLEVRRTLEPEIAYLAATRVTDAQGRALREIAGGTEVDGDDLLSYIARDLAFHDGLASATGNPLFSILLGSVRELLLENRRGTVRFRGARERALRHHMLILDAVTDHQPEAARERMREHLEQVSEDWRTARSG